MKTAIFLCLILVDVSRAIQDADARFAEYRVRKSVKVPREIKRRYKEWTTSPRNTTYLYHSIPVEVTHIEDRLFFMTSSYRRTNSTILKAHLWMEFPHFKRPARKLQFKKYLVDIIPVVNRRDVKEPGDCSATTVSSRVRFPEDEPEMRFDITSLYRSCRGADGGDSKYFKFKLRFHEPGERDVDILELLEDPDIFIIFRETDDHDDILELLSVEVEGDIVHRRNVEKMAKVPQLRHMKSRRRAASRPCSVRRWVLDFEQIGWSDWVYVPLQYEANVCHGRCPFPVPDHMNSTNYAIVRTIASTVFSKPRGACCVAKDLAPLTMIIKDEEKTTLKVQKDMITTSCACL